MIGPSTWFLRWIAQLGRVGCEPCGGTPLGLHLTNQVFGRDSTRMSTSEALGRAARKVIHSPPPECTECRFVVNLEIARVRPASVGPARPTLHGQARPRATPRRAQSAHQHTALRHHDRGAGNLGAARARVLDRQPEPGPGHDSMLIGKAMEHSPCRIAQADEVVSSLLSLHAPAARLRSAGKYPEKAPERFVSYERRPSTNPGLETRASLERSHPCQIAISSAQLSLRR